MSGEAICPKGMWVTEGHAVRKLGKSQAELAQGDLPSHAVKEPGSSVKAEPFHSHNFYYITNPGQSPHANQTIKLPQWVQLCQALEQSTELATFDPRAMALLARYSGRPIHPSTFDALIQDILAAEAVVLPKDLPATVASSNSQSLDALLGTALPRRVGESATISGPVGGNAKQPPPDEGEIYIRADGKKVRRVKKKRSSVGMTTAGNLAGVLNNNNSNNNNTGSGSATVHGDMMGAKQPPPAEEGEIYIRADGKKVRRVKKKRDSTTSAATTMAAPPSLGSVLDKNTGAATAVGSSATVHGDMVASKPMHTSGSASVGGAPTSGSSSANQYDEGEIYIRADGKKVRRVKKKRDSVTSVATTPVTVSSSASSTPTGLASLGIGGAAPTVGGSATVAGDYAGGGSAKPAEPQEGEIYIRADGKKVRRVKKPKPENQTLDSLLGANAVSSFNVGSGSATVSGATAAPKVEEGEIYIRADGKKVRRIRKVRSGSVTSGSASVAQVGQQEGEIYIRPDGKKVRRVKKMPNSDATANAQTLTSFLDSSGVASSLGGSATVAGDRLAAEGEVYIRPDGKKVRRIQRTIVTKEDEEEEKRKQEEEEAKKKPEEEAAKIADEEGENGEKDKSEEEQKGGAEEEKNADLASLLEKGDANKPMLSGSATVAGDMVISKDDEGEIIIKPDGTKVRRIRRSLSGENTKSLGALLNASGTVGQPGMSGSATVSGGDTEVEIYIRADGKKVRRIRRKPAVEEGEIYIRADGKKVRRIKKPVDTSNQAGDLAGDQTQQGLGDFLGSKEQQEAVRGVGDTENATVAGDMVTGVSMTALLAPEGQRADGQDNSAAVTDTEAVAFEQAPDVASSEAVAVPELETNDGAQHAGATTDGDQPPSADTTADGAAVAEAPGAEKATDAYIVVVGDEGQEVSGTQQVMEAPDDVPEARASMGEDGIQRFAVKVSQNEQNQPQQLKVETDTRYMTLDELAAMSGQSKEDLNKVIERKMGLSNDVPRFVIEPVVQQSQSTAPAAAAPPPVLAPPPTSAPAPAPAPPPPGARGKLLPEGMEAVPQEVADAARAISAMGASDLQEMMMKLQQGDIGEILKKLQEAEKRQKKLEKQLAQAGVAIAEDIAYDEAKAKVEEIAKRMNQIGGSDVTHPDKEEQNRLREEYFKLEQEMERYNTALMLTEEYQAEQDRLEREWDAENRPENDKALKALRRHMPVMIRHMSEAQLTTLPSPNGKYLPVSIAKKFKRTNVLMLLRINPDDIERMHPSTLDNMRVTGLTLTERRALYAHLEPVGPKWMRNKAEKMTERKWTWYQMMKNNFKENVAPYKRHCDQYGPRENHPYASRDDPNGGCPMIGKQCPVKADQMPDYYKGDYGWTEAAEFEVSNVQKSDVDDPGAKAAAEAAELVKQKKANERSDLLKKHYKGVMFVAKANGSCEQMDETMDKMESHMTKWIENMLQNEKFSDDDKKKEIAHFTDALNDLKLAAIDFCGRSGMQTSGKKKSGGDGPDCRSSVECSLAEDVYECSKEYFGFIRKRMDEMKVKDTRVSKTIELNESMLGDLHARNIETLNKLGIKRSDRSRKLRTADQLKDEVAKRNAPAVLEPEEDFGLTEAEKGPPIPEPPRGGRGGLLDAIAGRSKGRGDLGGRGGLMAAIQGRGTKGKGGADGGRGGLMAAIAGRGRGGAPGAEGGRGGLMAAIAARGAGPPGGPGGGRGGLMAAIAARGGGG